MCVGKVEKNVHNNIINLVYFFQLQMLRFYSLHTIIYIKLFSYLT